MRQFRLPGEALAAVSCGQCNGFDDGSARLPLRRGADLTSASSIPQVTAAQVGLSPAGEVLSWGAAAEALSGYAPEEIIGRNLDSIISEPFAAAARTAFAALRGGGSATFETLLRRKDGSLVEIAVDARTQPDGPGPSRVAAVIRDLTQSRRAGRRVEERLRLALGAAEIGTYEIDLMTERFALDACAAAIWGRDPGEILCYQSLAEQVLDEDRAPVRSALAAASAAAAASEGGGVGAYAAEFRIRRHDDGALRWVSLRGRAFFENGRAVSRVGVMVDITDKMNVEEDLRRREEFLRWIIRDAPIPIMLHAVDGAFVNVNRCFIEQSGYAQQDFRDLRDWFARGRRLAHDAVDEQLRALRSNAGLRKPFPPEEMPIWTKSGEERVWLVYRSLPFLSPEGIEIIVSAALDVTERKRSERANAHLAAIIAASDDAIYSLSKDGAVMSWNASAARMFGRDAETMIGASDAILVPANLRAERDALFEAAKMGAAVRRATQRQRRDGAVLDVLLNLAPMRGPDGGLTAISVLARDVTAEKRALAELERANARMAQQTAELDAIFEALNVPITVYNRRSEIVRTNAAARAVWGITPDHQTPIDFEDVAAKLSVRDGAGETIDPTALSARRALGGEIVTDEDYRITSPSGLRYDFNAAELPLIVAGEITGAISVWHDVTEHKRKDEQATILLRELSHRSKNLLSVIESILRQSAKGSGSKEDFVARFSERLHALANAHDLLARNNSLSVSMTDLIFSQVGHHWEPGQRRIAMSGLGVRLKPDAAQVIGMALHELSTNAAKYGALSNQTGRVSISWKIDLEDDDEPAFELKWIERGGPPVVLPARQGFGTTVIQRVAGQSLRGSATLDYLPQGVVWALRAPRSAVLDNAHADSPRGDRMRSAALEKLQDAWIELQRDGRLPRLADMPLRRIGQQDNLIVAEVDHGSSPPRVRFASVGKALTERVGLRFEGQELELTEAEILGTEDGAYRRCLRSAKPGYEYAYFNLGQGRSFFFERLLLPLSEDGQAITHIVGMASFEDGFPTRPPR